MTAIFIFGCPRSGTSLLARMLNNHPHIGIPLESHIFSNFYNFSHLYGDLSLESNRKQLVSDILKSERIACDWESIPDYSKVLSFIKKNDFGGVFEAILSCWAEDQQKILWAEKTPQHLYWWRPIFKYFPDAKVIYILRDGRDVCCSLLNTHFGPTNVYKAAWYWRNYLEQFEKMEEKIPNDQIQKVYYEDLLEKPDHILSEVCEFLGETFQTEMLDFSKKYFMANIDKTNLTNLQRSLIVTNKKKYLQNMTQKDIRIFESIAAEKLHKYGYENIFEEPKISFKEYFYYRWLKGKPARARKMIKNHKSQRAVLYRMKIISKLILKKRFQVQSENEKKLPN